MMCDELKAYKGDVTIPVYGTIADAEVYLKDKADEALSEKDKEIERLKESVKFFSDTLHRESDSAKECFRFLMNEGLISCWGLSDKFFVTAKYSKERLKKFESQDAEIRRLKRALYKACANWALSTLAWLDCIDQGEPRKWSEMRQKCLKKAEEYK